MPSAPEPRPSLDPKLIAEARRQAREIANSPEEEDMDLMEPPSPSQSESKPTMYPPEVVAEWQRAAREIARCPQEAEDIAWVESVSILFDDDNDAGRDRLS